MKRFLFFAVVATLFAGCSKDVLDEQQGIQNIVDEAPATLTVGFEDDETRIQLNSAQKTVWTNGDLVSVFYRSDANQQWQYTGETGERTADLTCVDAGEATEKINRVVVLYPYNESYLFNTETFNVQTTLPAEQTYLEDSYGLDSNIMVSSSEFNQFKLKTVYGWLKLQLTGNGEQVKSITVRGNNGEQVAGEAYINTTDATMTLAVDKLTTDDDGEVSGSLIFDNTILKEVTLDCGNGVTLGAEATAFYIALPPQTFTKGVTVEITATNGLVMTKSTDNEVVIERNHIKPMAAYAADLPIPETWKIYYTATAKVEPYDKTVFGATYVSNEWNSETGEGVITFDGDVTKIPERAFTDNDLKSINIPESVTTIEEGAFYGAYNIETFNGKFAADGGRILVSNGTLIAFASNCGVIEYTIPEDITKIGEGAFYNSDRLVNVEIGDNVTTLGRAAFNDCSGLNDVTIPDNVTTLLYFAFGACNHLKSVTIGSGVKTIEYDAFSYCKELSRVYIKATTPPTVVTYYNSYVGDHVWYAFDYVDSCLEIYVPASANDSIINAYKEAPGWSEYKDDIFEDEPKPANNEIWYTNGSTTAPTAPYDPAAFGSATIQSNTYDVEKECWVITFDKDVTKIGYNAFYGYETDCNKLTSVTIPDSVTTIGEYAFNYCKSLTSVTIPDSVTTIGDGAFFQCTSLTSVTIPDSVTTIGNSTFSSCTSLTSVTIPDSVTTIEQYAFSSCSNLTSVTIPDSVTTIGGAAFSSCYSLKEFKGKFAADGGRCLIIDGVLNAFALGCGVTQYTIPDSVTTIGGSAFAGCDSLTSVTIPDSVTTIGGYAFSNCDSLTSVTIPDSVTTIGDRAFNSCDSLKTVYCKPTTPPKGGSRMFNSNAAGRRIYVPKGSGNAYKAKQYWSDYADYIYEDASL